MDCATETQENIEPAPVPTNLVFGYLWKARCDLSWDKERHKRGSYRRRVHPSRIRTCMRRVLLCAEIAQTASHHTVRGTARRYVRDMPPLIRFWVDTMPPKVGDAAALEAECKEFEEKLLELSRRKKRR